ncbi:adenine phosphoribosyltransferase [Candidatus Woesearchaeota archaeon]|nr:adenine phosphoribosyltransferase [Candidatus Woesearchaeota archaeon]
MDLKAHIRTIPDFPKKGIMFRDVTTLLLNPAAFKTALEQLHDRYAGKGIALVAGIESRGFIFGAPLAGRLGVGFVPLRKKGKLPGPVERVVYDLEYGTDCLEVHNDAIKKGQHILLVDDLLATGGTAAAACKLIEKLGGHVVEAAFLVELPELKGRAKVPAPCFALVSFEGH